MNKELKEAINYNKELKDFFIKSNKNKNKKKEVIKVLVQKIMSISTDYADLLEKWEINRLDKNVIIKLKVIDIKSFHYNTLLAYLEGREYKPKYTLNISKKKRVDND